MRRDGSKVNVGRARLSNSSRLGPSKQQRRATRLWSVEKRSPVERRKDRGTIRGGVERAGGVCCRAKGAKRWGLAGATVALPLSPRGTPIGRMRAKVKLRQVVTPLLPSLLPRTVLPLSLSLSLHPRRMLLFPHGPVLRFLEVTSFPRETICGYGGRGES